MIRKFAVSFILLNVMGHSTFSHALKLREIEPPPEVALPIDTNQTSIPCDQIASRLENYNKLARQHDASVSSFLGEVTSKLEDWYNQLLPLEGTSSPIAIGTFLPLQDGATKISQVSDLAWENSTLLATEMDKIKTSLEQCTIQPKNK